LCDISCHAEVGVLVDCGRNEARNWLGLFVIAKYVRESVGEGGHGLHSRERKLAGVVRLVEAEYALDLVEGHVFLHLYGVGVQVLDIFHIAENEGLLWVEAESDDVFHVVLSHLDDVVKIEFWLVDVFFVVSDLNNEWHSKSILKVFREDKGDAVAQVESIGTGASSCVEIEG
jgi:hypothetical protein